MSFELILLSNDWGPAFLNIGDAWEELKNVFLYYVVSAKKGRVAIPLGVFKKNCFPDSPRFFWTVTAVTHFIGMHLKLKKWTLILNF